MPEIASETIKLLAVALGGVRAAARALNLSEPMVLQRSRRERWMDDPAVAEACRNGRSSIGEGSRSPAIVAPISPAQALANELQDLNGKSRVKLARGIHAAAEHIAAMDGQEIVEDATNVKSIVQAGGVLHGWSASEVPRCKIDLQIITDRAPQPPPAIEAEWTEGDGSFEG